MLLLLFFFIEPMTLVVDAKASNVIKVLQQLQVTFCTHNHAVLAHWMCKINRMF